MGEKRRSINSSVSDNYRFYFRSNIIQNADWAPNICCTTCLSMLHNFMKRKTRKMKFGQPMIWLPPPRHKESTCYVCVNKAALACGRKAAKSFRYKGTRYAVRPKPHSRQLPIPSFPAKSSGSPTEQQSSGEAVPVGIQTSSTSNCSGNDASGMRIQPNNVPMNPLLRLLRLKVQKRQAAAIWQQKWQTFVHEFKFLLSENSKFSPKNVWIDLQIGTFTEKI